MALGAKVFIKRGLRVVRTLRTKVFGSRSRVGVFESGSTTDTREELPGAGSEWIDQLWESSGGDDRRTLESDGECSDDDTWPYDDDRTSAGSSERKTLMSDCSEDWCFDVGSELTAEPLHGFCAVLPMEARDVSHPFGLASAAPHLEAMGRSSSAGAGRAPARPGARRRWSTPAIAQPARMPTPR